MKLSIVCVCLNSQKTIGYMIESFLKQHYANKELLIIDGASQDKTIEISESFRSDAIRVFSERDRGIYDAMNKGLDRFAGDAVGFLGSDDAFHSERSLDLLAQALGEADVVYGDLHIVRDQVSKHIVRTYKPGPFHSRSFRRGFMPPHTTFYVRRHVVDTVGYYDTRYRIGSDYDYVLRVMALNDFRIAYVPEILIDFQLGGTSSRGLRSVLTHNLEALDSRRRFLKTRFVDAAFFLKPARSLLQVHWR